MDVNHEVPDNNRIDRRIDRFIRIQCFNGRRRRWNSVWMNLIGISTRLSWMSNIVAGDVWLITFQYWPWPCSMSIVICHRHYLICWYVGVFGIRMEAQSLYSIRMKLNLFWNSNERRWGDLNEHRAFNIGHCRVCALTKRRINVSLSLQTYPTEYYYRPDTIAMLPMRLHEAKHSDIMDFLPDGMRMTYNWWGK